MGDEESQDEIEPKKEQQTIENGQAQQQNPNSLIAQINQNPSNTENIPAFPTSPTSNLLELAHPSNYRPTPQSNHSRIPVRRMGGSKQTVADTIQKTRLSFEFNSDSSNDGDDDDNEETDAAPAFSLIPTTSPTLQRIAGIRRSAV